MINYISAMLMLYTISTLSGCLYLFFRLRFENEQARQEFDQNFGFLLLITGIVATLLALHMITTYPINIPNTPLYLYNEQFGVPYTLFGIIALTTGYSLWKRLDPKPISYFAFFAGIFNLRYAVNFIEFGLTREPIMAFLLYLTVSLVAIVSPLFTHIKDESKQKLIGYLMIVLLLITGIIAGIIGIEAARGHIAEALMGG